MPTKHDFSDKVDKQSIIWRFMSFPKFVSLLETRSLFCATLGLFVDDPFEGQLPDKDNKAFLKADKAFADTQPDVHIMSLKEDMQRARTEIYVNCWYIGQYEPIIMWRLHSNNEEGVAVKITYGKLQSSVSDTETKITMRPIRYIDFDEDSIFDKHPVLERANYAFYKRKNFEHERELRLAVDRGEVFKTNPGYMRDVRPDWTYGCLLPVSLDILIEQIYVSPQSKGWFVELVKSVCTRYSLEKEVRPSTLTRKPDNQPS